MASKKKYDLCVKTGEYQVNGETKSRYLAVGSVMTRDDGGFFILLNRAFNPAGVPVQDSSKDSIIISCFDPKPSAKGAESSVADDMPF